MWGHMPQFLVAVLFSDPLAPVARRISICTQCPGCLTPTGHWALALDLTADMGLAWPPETELHFWLGDPLGSPE